MVGGGCKLVGGHRVADVMVGGCGGSGRGEWQWFFC